MIQILKVLAALLLASLVAFVVGSTGEYVFHHTATGRGIMTSMLEWASTGYHWSALIALVFCFGGYSVYELVKQLKRRAVGDRRLTFAGQMGHLSIFLSFSCLLWAAFGRVYHH